MKTINIPEEGDKIRDIDNGRVYVYVGYGANYEYEDHTFINPDDPDDYFSCSDEVYMSNDWQFVIENQ